MFDTEYSYDMPSTSSHHHHHIPFHHHHHSKYSPSTKSADISRLLDPSYSSHSAYHSQTRVYVDHHGDLHDPDFRHFPASPPPQKSKSRRNRRVSDSDPFSPRPQWELGIDCEEFDSYEDDSALYQPTYPSRRSSSLTRHKPTYMTHSSPFYPVSPSSSGSYTPSPPTSFEDDETFFSESPDSVTSSPFEDDRKCTTTNILTKKFRRQSRKGTTTSATTTSATTTSPTTTSPISPARPSLDSISYPYPYTEEPESDEHVHPIEGGEEVEEDFHRRRRSLDQDRDHHEDDEGVADEEDEDEDDEEQRDAVPSCTQAMKKQWQAVSLSVRFGVFRARRRMRRVLSR